MVTSVREWRLRGDQVQACNCDWGCPCNFNARPSRGNCEGAWVWHIREGEVDGLDLAGCTVALACRWPGAIHEGNGTGLPIIDASASEQQREALLTLLSGSLGGPWRIIAATLSTVLAPRFVAFETRIAGPDTVVRAGDLLAMEFEVLRNPVSGAALHPEVVKPEGFVNKRSGIGRSKRFRVGGGIDYDWSGQDAEWAEFEYRGP